MTKNAKHEAIAGAGANMARSHLRRLEMTLAEALLRLQWQGSSGPTKKCSAT
jgi:hypothetical protein